MLKHKGLIRIFTAGSIDDGKSTLIGRLMYDSNSISNDHLDKLKDSNNEDFIDFSKLTDGLKEEQNNNITIDVAYRYFSSNNYNYILADSPGHFEYMKNMACAVSFSDIGIILIDSQKGFTELCKKHLYISSLFGIKTIVFAVNKMDSINYNEEQFQNIKNEVLEFSKKLNVDNQYFIPTNAITGENIVSGSLNMTWFKGQSIMDLIETKYLSDFMVSSKNDLPLRLPIQNVIEYKNAKYYTGQITSGSIHLGQEISIASSDRKAQGKVQVKSIRLYKTDLPSAFAGQSVTIELSNDNQLNFERGDQITSTSSPPQVSNIIEATILWFSTSPLKIKNEILIKHSTRIIPATVLNINLIELIKSNSSNTKIVNENEVAKVSLKLDKNLVFDSFYDNKKNGTFIIIDKDSKNTVGTGIIR